MQRDLPHFKNYLPKSIKLLCLVIGIFAVSNLTAQTDTKRINTNNLNRSQITRSNISGLQQIEMRPQFQENNIILNISDKDLRQYQIYKYNSANNLVVLNRPGSQINEGRLELQPGETIALKDTAKDVSPVETLSIRKRIYLPGQFIKNTGTKPGEDKPTLNKWRLFMEATDSPLAWSTEKKAYSTDIIIGLESDDGKTKPLGQNVKVQFRKIGGGIQLSPEHIYLNASGFDNSKKVTLACTSFDINPEVEILSDIGKKRIGFPLQPRRLEIIIPDAEILGFGLETAEIKVKPVGTDGSIIKDESLNILLYKSGNGKLTESDLTKPSGALFAHTNLTSSGTGDVLLSAESPLFLGDEATIKYIWPITLLIISLLGGIIGSAVRLYRGNRPKGGRLVAHLLVGMLGGFLFVLAAAIGITQTETAPSLATTNIGAIVLSLVGGYAGDGVFEWLSKRFGLA